MTQPQRNTSVSERKHTAGPWSISLASGGSWNGATIWSGGVKVATITRPADKSLEQKAADARLIAAAPRLLAALSELRDAYSFLGDPDQPSDAREARMLAAMEAAEAAISSTTQQGETF